MFRHIQTKDLALSPFSVFSHDWGLLTVKDGSLENSMTVSWGGLGHLWNRDVVYLFVRPQRYTYSLLPTAQVSLVFLEDGHRDACSYLGKASGRDTNKIEGSGLTPLRDEDGLYFEEAKLVFFGSILYQSPFLAEGFRDQSLVEKHYSKADFSDMLVLEVTKILTKD